MPAISIFFGIVVRMYYDDHASTTFSRVLRRAFGNHRDTDAYHWQWVASASSESIGDRMGCRSSSRTARELAVGGGARYFAPNRTVGVIMPRIIFVRVLSDWRLEIRFDNGVSGIIALKDRLFGPMFEPLQDPAFFARVDLDGFGSICRPNGADLAPDAIHENLSKVSAIA
jgi:hypothetical protein